MTGHDYLNLASGRLQEKARQYFGRADKVIALFTSFSRSVDVPRLARAIMNDQVCEAMGLPLLTRKVLVLPTMIKLRGLLKRDPSSRVRENLQSLERDLMDWNRRWPGPLTVGGMDDVQIWFSFLGELLLYCDMSHYPPELVADYTSEDTRWGIANATLRGDPLICAYIRKWELGWRRFLPWSR